MIYGIIYFIKYGVINYVYIRHCQKLKMIFLHYNNEPNNMFQIGNKAI